MWLPTRAPTPSTRCPGMGCGGDRPTSGDLPRDRPCFASGVPTGQVITDVARHTRANPWHLTPWSSAVQPAGLGRSGSPSRPTWARLPGLRDTSASPRPVRRAREAESWSRFLRAASSCSVTSARRVAYRRRPRGPRASSECSGDPPSRGQGLVWLWWSCSCDAPVSLSRRPHVSMDRIPRHRVLPTRLRPGAPDDWSPPPGVISAYIVPSLG